MVLKLDLCKELKDKTSKNITELAKHLGISRQSFYESLHGNGSRKIRVAIAVILEKSPLDLFIYDNDHKRLLDVHEYEKLQGGSK